MLEHEAKNTRASNGIAAGGVKVKKKNLMHFQVMLTFDTL